MTKFRSVLFVLVALVGLTIGLQAHMKLEKSDPASGSTLTAAPKSINLHFNEKIDVAVSKVALKGPAGEVKLGPAHAMGEKHLMADVQGTVGDGAYTISWQSAGPDGHVQKGDIAFTVKLKTTE